MVKPVFSGQNSPRRPNLSHVDPETGKRVFDDGRELTEQEIKEEDAYLEMVKKQE